MEQNPSLSEQLPDEKQYADFIRDLELVAIRLESCRSDFIRESFVDGGGSISYTVDVGFEDPVDSTLDAIVTVRARAKPRGTKKMCTKVDCTFVLTYEIGLDPDEGILKTFARNVEVNAWPYVREFIQSITARMAGPTLLLPLRKQ